MVTGTVQGVVGGWFMPERVVAEGEVLVVHWGDDVRRTQRPGLLDEFMALGEARDAATFARFASRWGVLEVCRHGLPIWHAPNQVIPLALPKEERATRRRHWINPDRILDNRPSETRCGRITIQELVRKHRSRDEYYRRLMAGEFDADETVEPIQVWRYWARRALAIRTVIRQARDDAPIDSEELGLALGYDPATGPQAPDVRGRDAVKAAAECVDAWLDAGGGARLRHEWTENGGVVPVFHCEGLFGAIGLQLSSELMLGKVPRIGRSGEVKICNLCYGEFVASRRNRKYCDGCLQSGADAALRQRNKYARDRKNDRAALPQSLPQNH
jgi:hypothetical protein